MRSVPNTMLLMMIIAVAATAVQTTTAAECWRRFEAMGWCRDNLYISYKQKRLVGLGVECCNRIKELGDPCFKEIFQNGPFSLEFGNAVKDYCSWMEQTPAPSPASSPEYSASAPQARLN